MDFDPRDFDDSRDRDRRGDRSGPSLGRGPSSRDDDSEFDAGDRDDARWNERERDHLEQRTVVTLIEHELPEVFDRD
jgi:hypothetical protein